MGYVGTGSKVTWIGASHRADLAFTASLVYANGSLWAFDSGENVARISPVTGRIIKIYSAARYDPQDNLSLNFFAVDRNSIWFLRADGYETTAVLRVSLATGRRIGRVSGVGSCGEPCWQIYVAQGSAWVPTQTQLVRISPGRAKG
jgi:streptogramin lyase